MTTKALVPRHLEFHELEPLVGQTFLADCDPRPVPLELVEVRPVRLTGSIIRPQFTLIFRSAPAAFLVAGIYTMRCGLFGPEMIYIAPTNASPGATGSGHYYQAAFS
jgi:hypothetical protein